MSYSRFTVEDFVLNRDFRQWVLAPDTKSNRFWQSWLERHPEKEETLREARAIVLKLPRINYGWNSTQEEELWDAIARKTRQTGQFVDTSSDATPVVPINSATVVGASSHRSRRRRPNYQRVARIAASVLLILGLGVAVYVGSHETKPAPPAIAYLTKEAPAGAKLRFHLPDGSIVSLNAESSVRFPERFTAQERAIEVRGEVYLEVAPDRSRPFRVRTGSVVTEALGTAFNVRYELDNVEIALVEGKVQVSLDHAGAQDRIILLPGEQATLKGKDHLVKDTFSTERITAWQSGTLILEEASEPEVIRALERWYGVTISTEGSAAKPWRFTGKFRKKSLEYVLQSIGYTMDFHYSISDKEVKIIYPKPPPSGE